MSFHVPLSPPAESVAEMRSRVRDAVSLYLNKQRGSDIPGDHQSDLLSNQRSSCTESFQGGVRATGKKFPIHRHTSDRGHLDNISTGIDVVSNCCPSSSDSRILTAKIRRMKALIASDTHRLRELKQRIKAMEKSGLCASESLRLTALDTAGCVREADQIDESCVLESINRLPSEVSSKECGSHSNDKTHRSQQVDVFGLTSQCGENLNASRVGDRTNGTIKLKDRSYYMRMLNKTS